MNRIWKGIPVFNYLREEWEWGIKSQLMIITAPNLDNKVVCWNAGSTL